MTTTLTDIPAETFTIYSKSDYYRDLSARIAQTVAGDRVALTTMVFEPRTPEVQLILETLYAAARRGVVTNLTVDAYAFLLSPNKIPTTLWFRKTMPKHLPAHLQVKLHALEELQVSGGRYSITNKPVRPLSNPFAGRSHVKCAVINDRIYLGGCNLNSPKDIDIMVGWDDKRTSDWVFDLSKKIANGSSTITAMHHQDLEFPVDSKTTLLVDSGKRGQSIIFDKALELIDQAEKAILITCQFFPNDITTKHLIKAHKRGVEVNIIYNHPGKHVPVHNILHQFVIWREKARSPASFFKGQLSKKQRFIHAKLIATEQGAIVGSHNYVSAGVSLGTAEIALLRLDPDFAENAVAAIDHALAMSKL